MNNRPIQRPLPGRRISQPPIYNRPPYTPTRPTPTKRGLLTLERIVLSLSMGLIMFIVPLFAAVGLSQVWYMGRIYPGISVAGIALGGLAPADASRKILSDLRFAQDGRVILYDGEQRWSASPAELGLTIDVEATTEKVFSIGRQGNPIQRLVEQFDANSYTRNISPVYVFDQRLAFDYVSHLAQQIDRPIVEASLSVNGTEIIVHQGQTGRVVDVQATLDQLALQFSRLQDGAVPLVIRESQPMVVDVTRQAEQARLILSQPLTLTLPAGQSAPTSSWMFDQNTLAAMLSFETVQTPAGNDYQVALKTAALVDFLARLAPELKLSPQNTRFIFNDETRLLEIIQPAVIGRVLNVDASIRSIQEKIVTGEHTIPLEFIYESPQITDQVTAEQLGIRELVYQQISYFYGSSADRIQNIQLAAANFHGLLVAPGETFSMSANMGEVSLDNGYAEALIILGGQTIKGVGGGVCQVSTTLFRAAFFAGFPIVERHPHAYRVSYYEKTASNQVDPNLAGLDATVFVPLVDLKFTNDTPSWLLMETYVNEASRMITWKFYSTNDGRQVAWETSGPVNIVEAPKPLYKENPELPQGEVKQVDWEAEGADVTVKRTVTRAGQIILQDEIYTHYQPWQAIYEYGPGTEGMPPPEEPE